jgi:hypothetical protein
MGHPATAEANTRGYGKVFVDVLKTAAERAVVPGASVGDAVLQALHGNPDQLSWPDDDDLIVAFTTRKVYGSMTQERIRLVLGSIDEYLQRSNPKTEPATFQYETLQIEHVMPQAWRDHWPLTASTEADRSLEAQRRDQAVQQFGNLTLVTSTFNQSVSNAAWAAKQTAFKEQSKLQLNHSIAACSTWDVDAIQNRGKQLARLAALVWPR